MGSSAGRRKADYVKTRTLFQTGQYVCWMCNERPGLTVDHQPPLHLYPNEDAWRAAGGTYHPACQPCQSRQGAAIANRRPTWTF